MITDPDAGPGSRRIFVGGEFVPAHSARDIPVINPATEQPIGTIPDCDQVDIDRAVAAAREAFPAWSATSPQDRSDYLRALADEFEDRQDEMAALVTRQNGSVISRSRRTNGRRPVAHYRSGAIQAASFTPEETVAVGGTGDGQMLIRREPIGVVGAIVPWNAPQSLLARKLTLAIVAGCTVVVKPSPETSLDAYLLADMFDSIDLPPGVVNIVTGGRTTGAQVVSHPGVDKISFTGSTAAGRAIASTCGELLKPVTAELGGKSAAVVLDDADLEQFALSLVSICLPNTGQVCYSCTRVLAPRRLFDEVLEVVVSTLRAAKLGDPTDPASEFGPLVSAAQRNRVEAYIASGIADGARLVLGGRRPASMPVGYYVEPTVFADVRSQMRIFQEEIFGPVLVVVPYEDDDDAVHVANDSAYGLGGAVFGRDVERAMQVARRIDTGAVTVNGRAPAADVRYGHKDSGVGGDPGLPAYLQVKAIGVP